VFHHDELSDHLAATLADLPELPVTPLFERGAL
jgi:hypothetical protein